NKDRPESRRAFGAKCAAYLQKGIGVVMADIVTNRQFNLHNELVDVMRLGDEFRMLANVFLYGVAYRPARRDGGNVFDVWTTPLAVGGSLPLLPLALKGARAVPLDLEAAYTLTRERARM